MITRIAGTYDSRWARINRNDVSNVPNARVRKGRHWRRNYLFALFAANDLLAVRPPGVRDFKILVGDPSCCKDTLAGGWLRGQRGPNNSVTRIGSCGDRCFDDRANFFTTVSIHRAGVQRRRSGRLERSVRRRRRDHDRRRYGPGPRGGARVRSEDGS